MDPFHPWTWNMLFIFSLSYLCAFSFLLLPSWGYMWTTSHLIMKASPFWKKSNYAWHPFLASKWKWRHIVVNCADILIAISCWYSLATIFEGTKHSHWSLHHFWQVHHLSCGIWRERCATRSSLLRPWFPHGLYRFVAGAELNLPGL